MSNHFLYNKEKDIFVENKSLDSIDNIELIGTKKEICSNVRDGMMGHSLIKYRWENNSLIKIEKYEEGIGADGKLYISIEKNSIVVVKDSVLNKSVVENMKCE
jgi:hypothetical protein